MRSQQSAKCFQLFRCPDGAFFLLSPSQCPGKQQLVVTKVANCVVASCTQSGLCVEWVQSVSLSRGVAQLIIYSLQRGATAGPFQLSPFSEQATSEILIVVALGVDRTSHLTVSCCANTARTRDDYDSWQQWSGTSRFAVDHFVELPLCLWHARHRTHRHDVYPRATQTGEHLTNFTENLHIWLTMTAMELRRWVEQSRDPTPTLPTQAKWRPNVDLLGRIMKWTSPV